MMSPFGLSTTPRAPPSPYISGSPRRPKKDFKKSRLTKSVFLVSSQGFGILLDGGDDEMCGASAAALTGTAHDLPIGTVAGNFQSSSS